MLIIFIGYISRLRNVLVEMNIRLKLIYLVYCHIKAFENFYKSESKVHFTMPQALLFSQNWYFKSVIFWKYPIKIIIIWNYKQAIQYIRSRIIYEIKYFSVSFEFSGSQESLSFPVLLITTFCWIISIGKGLQQILTQISPCVMIFFDWVLKSFQLRWFFFFCWTRCSFLLYLLYPFIVRKLMEKVIHLVRGNILI